MKLRVVRGAALALAASCALALSPVAAQERSAVRQGFELSAGSGKRILVFRPSVSVGSQSTGGTFEPQAEWTEQAKANIANSLRAFQGRLGNTVIEAPEAYGEQAQVMNEHMALFAAISDAVIE